MVTGEVTGSTVTPSLEQNKVMILNGPVFLREHRPIVLRSFLSDFCLTFTDLHHWVMWGKCSPRSRNNIFFLGSHECISQRRPLWTRLSSKWNTIQEPQKHISPLKMKALTIFFPAEDIEITNDTPPLYSWIIFNAQGFFFFPLFLPYKCMHDYHFSQGCFAIRTAMPRVCLLFPRKPLSQAGAFQKITIIKKVLNWSI